MVYTNKPTGGNLNWRWKSFKIGELYISEEDTNLIHPHLESNEMRHDYVDIRFHHCTTAHYICHDFQTELPNMNICQNVSNRISLVC